MNVSALVPPAVEHIAFDLYAIRRLVDCTGCYCLSNAAGDILYAGQALSIRGRLTQHFDSEKRGALTPYGRVSLAWWRPETAAKIDALERGWLEYIRLYDGDLPPLNRISGPL